jgi:hypothetical protein
MPQTWPAHVTFAELWLPILLSVIAVFIVSSVIHMLSPWHKDDYPRLENEEGVLDALRPLAIPPGDYMMPRPRSRAELTAPEFVERVRRGPVLIMTMLPNGPMAMGRSLAGWFVYIVVVVLFAALEAVLTLRRGAHGHDVFHVVALVALAGFTLALWQMHIWYRRSLATTMKATVDGAIYAALAGLAFAWLWPH